MIFKTVCINTKIKCFFYIIVLNIYICSILWNVIRKKMYAIIFNNFNS